MSAKEMSIEERYPYHISDVHISDPFILADPVSKKYYTYVQFADRRRFPEISLSDPCFFVLESEDLIHWSRPEVCFRKGDFWADLDYWAPEVHIWKGRYYLISSFRAKGLYRRCQCLVSDSPKGPFVPVGTQPVTPKGWQCLDGPFLHRLKSGVLLMLWPGFASNGGYTTGYARSLSGDILGPWVQERQPLYAMDGAHSMLFTSFGGQLMMALHCPNRHEAKRILLFEMEESFDSIHIVNEVTGNWYDKVSGIAEGYAYREPCREEPCFRTNPAAKKKGEDGR